MESICTPQELSEWKRQKKEKKRFCLDRWRANNPDKWRDVTRRYREKHRVILRSKRKADYWKDVEVSREYQRKVRRDHRNDGRWKIRGSHSASIRRVLTKANVRQRKKMAELTGCSTNFLKQYIERQFTDSMTWENYGNGEANWQVDHIVPISVFDLQDEWQRRACFHYSNLQPLWRFDNQQKSDLLTCPPVVDLTNQPPVLRIIALLSVLQM